jgi:hypothetical protein
VHLQFKNSWRRKLSSLLKRLNGSERDLPLISVVWQSNTASRWRELAQLNFGKYEASISSDGQMFIKKGVKVLSFYSELIYLFLLLFM